MRIFHGIQPEVAHMFGGCICLGVQRKLAKGLLICLQGWHEIGCASLFSFIAACPSASWLNPKPGFLMLLQLCSIVYPRFFADFFLKVGDLGKNGKCGVPMEAEFGHCFLTLFFWIRMTPPPQKWVLAYPPSPKTAPGARLPTQRAQVVSGGLGPCWLPRASPAP